MYGGIVSADDDTASRPLLEPLQNRGRSSWTLGRVTRYAGAASIGALVVAAGFIGSDPSHPALQKFRGLRPSLGNGRDAATTQRAPIRRAAPTPAHHHRLGSLDADTVGRLGEDDIAQIDNLDEQVERLTRELTDARSENTELEKQVQNLEQSIVDTREEFLKIGHGGKNKHLAGSHENEIIADLEIQLKDKHYELEKTRQQKYKLYVKNNECNSAQADLDKSVAECKKNMIEYAERATALEKMESCSAEKEAVESKLTTATEKLEVALADLAAARGDDHDDNSRIASLESKLGDCHDTRDASADTIADYKKAVETDRLDLAARQRLIDELNAKAAASDELADRLKTEVSQLVEDVQACELDGKSFDFFCAGEDETCDCPDGDIVWGPRYHASDPEKANTFADVIATQNFIVHPGKSGFECTNKHVGGDPESGQPKACFCAPKGLNYDVKASADVEQPSPAPAVAEQPAPPAPEVVEEPAVDAADVESYEDALESAPAPAQPEVEPVDVSEELSKQFEENVGDDTIRDVETDAEIREDESAATPAPHSHTNASDSDSDSGVHLKGEDWKKYDEEDLEDLYEDLNESLSEDEELPEGVDEAATRVAAENAAAAKAEAEAKAAAEQSFGECQAMCAAEQECCNIDIVQGSNQRLSCLQACTMVRGGVTEDQCNAECADVKCDRTVNGVTYHHCNFPGCGDVPAHKDAFGDKFQPAPYECAAQWGTDDNSCKKGCLNGVTDYEAFKTKKAAEEKAKAETEAATVKAFGDCQAMCAAEHECCNIDITQGSNQRLSCLQACTMVKGGVTADQCNAECAKPTCERTVNGVTYKHCAFPGCGDVPARKNDFGDKFQPAPYECAARFGTDDNSCKKGCINGVTDIDDFKAKKAAEAKAEAEAAAAKEAAFGDCQAICAAEHECCNNDIKQGSSQKLSCLQACVMVKGGVTEDACNAECPRATCNFQVGGESYPACTVCDDVPAHKNHFGDKFKPADYTCSAHYGTHADGCKKGCAAGTTDFDTYKAEKEAAEKAIADAKAAGTWKRTGFETKTDVTNAVKECQKTNFAGDDCVMNWWDVSKITDMSFMLDCNQRRGFDREFNQDISKWDVSHVTDMRHMIQDCYLFNQDLSNWDMSNVQDARFMFNGAKAFKSDLSKWNPASATNWMGMFQLTDNFKSDLSGWKFPDGYNEYKNFFFRATAFHKALAPPQVLANPQDRTFNECCTCPDPIATPSPTIPAATVPTRTGFNHKNDVINAVKDCQNKGWEGDECVMNTWDISKITDMGHMLRCSMGRGFPSDFNQDISLWDVSHVTDMNNMLGGCSVFNRDLSQWDVSKVGAANGLFSGCNEFNADISKWNPASATNWEFLLNDATAFNQDLSGWKFPDGYRHWRNFFRNAKNMDKSRMPAGVTNDGLPGCCSCPPHDPVSNPWPESVAEYMEAKAAAAAAAEAAEAKNFGDCQAICAAEHECCNNDIKQGSSQKLSCLQACVMVKGGVTEDACNAECPRATCNFQVGGESYPACTVCDDVPAHKNHFGDKFKPADYTCSAHYGTHADGCKKGCAAGTTDFDTYKAEKEAAEAEAAAKAEAEAEAKAKAKAEAEAKAKAEAEAEAVAQPKNVQGRYVRLSKTGIINVAELYVWKRDGTELVNLAAGKPTTCGSPPGCTYNNRGGWPNSEPGNLVDGDVSRANGLVHSDMGDNNLLKDITIDLGAETDIDGLLLINRLDGPWGKRTVGMKVEVLDSNKNAVMTTTINEQHAAYVLDLSAGVIGDQVQSDAWKSVSGVTESSNFDWKPLVPAAPVAAPAEAGSKFEYDFTVNVPSHHAAGPAIFTIEMDGVLVPEDQFTIHVPINNWECWKYPRGPGCASGQIGMTDDDTETQSFWSNIAAGTKLFTITTTKKVSQMEIKYKGPLHAPGWLIEENGVEILKETANRGSASRPDPITYTYDFPKAEAVAVAQPKNVQGRYVRLSKTGIINLNELYVWKRDGTELVNLAAGKSVTGDNPEHESGNFPYHNLVDGDTIDRSGMAHTKGYTLKTITVDLGTETDIDGLLLINRLGCCGDRTVGLKVEVLDANKNAIVTTTINEEHSAYVLDLAAGADEWKSVSGAGQSSNFNWKPLVPAAPVAAPAEAVAVAQPKNVQGRYVRLSKTGIINLNELYVWKRDGSELVNLAAGKSVTGDSSDHHSGRFSYQNLVNGDTSDRSGMAHTNMDDTLKTITVDLGTETDIDGLLLVNRLGCCGERTVGLKVEVLDANKNAIVTTTINEEHSAYVLDLAAGADEWKSVSGAGQSSNFNWKPLVPAA